MAVLKQKSIRVGIRQQLYDRLEKEGVSLPEALKSLRKILSWDQTRLAKEAGISLSALRRIEQGHTNVRLDTIQKILEVFSLSVVVVKR
jgi:predicted transcriptional regulator